MSERSLPEWLLDERELSGGESGPIVVAEPVPLLAEASGGESGPVVVSELERRDVARATVFGAPRSRTVQQNKSLSKLMHASKRARIAERRALALEDAQGPDPEVTSDAAEAVAVAFSNRRSNITCLSQLHGISRTKVRRLLAGVAHVYVKEQGQAMQAALDSLRHDPPILCWDRAKWDEASHRFCLGTVGDVLAHQASKKWSLCRVRWHVGWSCMDGKESQMELLCPPVPCVGPVTASCLFNALFETHGGREIADFLLKLRALSSRALSIRECDAAGPNLKLLCWEARMLRRSMCLAGKSYYHSEATCAMHGGQRIVERVAAANGDFHRALHALASVLGTGSFFLRLVQCVRPLLQPHFVRIVHEDPPARVRANADLLCDFFMPPQDTRSRVRRGQPATRRRAGNLLLLLL